MDRRTIKGMIADASGKSRFLIGKYYFDIYYEDEEESQIKRIVMGDKNYNGIGLDVVKKIKERCGIDSSIRYGKNQEDAALNPSNPTVKLFEKALEDIKKEISYYPINSEITERIISNTKKSFVEELEKGLEEAGRLDCLTIDQIYIYTQEDLEIVLDIIKELRKVP